jgi:hypothetical protein
MTEFEFPRGISISQVLRAITGGDTPEDAVEEKRCLKPPLGCGSSVHWGDFPEGSTAAEWKISGLCSSCQIKLIEEFHPGCEVME